MSTARRVRRRLRQLGFGRLLVAVPCVFLSIYCWGFVPLSFTVLSIVLYLPLLDVPVVIFRDRDVQACLPVTQVMGHDALFPPSSPGLARENESVNLWVVTSQRTNARRRCSAAVNCLSCLAVDAKIKWVKLIQLYGRLPLQRRAGYSLNYQNFPPI